MLQNRVEVYPLKVDEPASVDSCAEKPIGGYIAQVLSANSLTMEDHDVLVIVSKLVSVFEGRIIRISEITPSLEARLVGRAFSKDPKKLELVLGEGRVQGVLPMKHIYKIHSWRAKLSILDDDLKEIASYWDSDGAMFMIKHNGVLLDDAGIDLSNVPEGCAALLPVDANASARAIRRSVYEATGKEVAVVVTDTAGVAGKFGGQDIALGCAGLDPISRRYFDDDVFGQPSLGGGIELIADSLAAMGGLLMGQSDEGTPICLIRGFSYKPEREEGGMKVTFTPPNMWLRSAFLVVFATVFYYFLHILTLPFSSRKKTSNDGDRPRM